ncbi:TPA: hypothetical protein N0F65_004396 [Lagenidium giganteum]|uniref:Uncharacterized protein n=1 Tax=Lagenidium giganteum TaxID=4803 RepID=A0AAV2ZJD2_9STRA|nr:TPA: hypothetical protein N0F65_004396 [Lagenidium giganteum]
MRQFCPVRVKVGGAFDCETNQPKASTSMCSTSGSLPVSNRSSTKHPHNQRASQ